MKEPPKTAANAIAKPAHAKSQAAKAQVQGLYGLARRFEDLQAQIHQLEHDKLAQRAPAAWRAAWMEEANALTEQQYDLIAQAVATAAAHPHAAAAKMELLRVFALHHQPVFADLEATRLDLMGSIAKDLAVLAARA